MTGDEQILHWYRSLTQVSQDDRADFEIMLLDKKNPKDALVAINGLTMNMMEHGYNKGVFSLLLTAARADNVKAVRLGALGTALFGLTLYDDAFRQSQDIVEQLLDVLAEDGEMAYTILLTLWKAKKTIRIIGPQKDLRDTLVYKLVVVGQEANQAFGRSC